MPTRAPKTTKVALSWTASVLDIWKQRPAGVSTSEAIYLTLRRAIVDGVLPAGERLAENHLASLFKRSRTPIREAIFRLESERLAEYLPRQGLVVATITREEILEVYAVRSVLDGLAASLAAQGIPAAELEHLAWLNSRIKTSAENGDYDAIMSLNFELHEGICRAGRNTVLLQLMKQINDRLRRFRGSVHAYPGRSLEAAGEHDAILDAIQRRDADAADRLARAHMMRAMQLRIAMQQSSFSGGFAAGAPGAGPSGTGEPPAGGSPVE